MSLIDRLKSRLGRKTSTEGDDPFDVAPVKPDTTGTSEKVPGSSTVGDAPRKRSFFDRLKRRPASTGVDLVKLPEDSGKKSAFRSFLDKLSKKKSAETEGDDKDVSMSSDGLEEIRSVGDVVLSFDGDATLEVGRKKIVLGLIWEADRTSDTIKSQAASLGDAMVTYDLVANFKDGNQLGFSSTGAGMKPGMKAGVTAVTPKRMGKSWVGAFRLNAGGNHWWIAGVRNGQVYEDQIATDPETARAIFLENLQAPGWQRAAAPSHWEIGGTEDIDLKDVLFPGGGVSLKPVRPLKMYAARIIAIFLIIALGTGGFLYYQNMKEQERLRQEETQRKLREEVRVAPADYPWFDTPSAERFIRGCAPRMSETLVFVPGWSQDVISCSLQDGSGIVATSWSNSNGTVPWMAAAFPPDKPQPSIDVMGQSASYNLSVAFDVPPADLAEPWEEGRINLILNRRVQTLELDNVTVTPFVQRVTPVQQREMRKPVFNRHDVNVQTGGALHEYVRLFSDFPAVVPKTLVYETSTGTWNLTLSVYHPAILPTAAQ